MRWNPGTCGWSFKEGRLPSATRTIMAPELWRVWYERKGYILSSSDVWSLGCTMLDVWLFVFGTVSEHPEGYFVLPWMRAAYHSEGDISWVKQCFTEACSIWRPRNGNRQYGQGKFIDDWDVVRGGLEIGSYTQGGGKYELRKSLLYFIFNCLLEPVESLRFSAREVLNTLKEWQKKLWSITSTNGMEYSRIQEEIQKISVEYGEIFRDSRKLDSPCFNSMQELPAGKSNEADSEARRRKVQAQWAGKREWGCRVPGILPWKRQSQAREASQEREARRRAKHAMPYQKIL